MLDSYPNIHTHKSYVLFIPLGLKKIKWLIRLIKSYDWGLWLILSYEKYSSIINLFRIQLRRKNKNKKHENENDRSIY